MVPNRRDFEVSFSGLDYFVYTESLFRDPIYHGYAWMARRLTLISIEFFLFCFVCVCNRAVFLRNEAL